MKRLTLCALLLSLCAAARGADDRLATYGAEPPNGIQQYNRRFSLIETALFYVGYTKYSIDYNNEHGTQFIPALPGFKAEAQSGYFPDRGAAFAAIDALYKQATAAVTFSPNPSDPFDVQRAKRDAFKPDLAASARVAGQMRPRLKAIAQFYLASTQDGKGPPEGLTALENDLLVGFMEHAGDPEWDAFVPHLTGTRIPLDPLERYKHAVNVSDARALLRGLLVSYVAQTSFPEFVNVTAEYAQVDAAARALTKGDAAALAPFYTAAGMTRPKPPAAGKPFVEQFTNQESASLAFIQMAGPAQKEFEADRDKADADATALPGLLGKWKKRALDEAKGVRARRGAYAQAAERRRFEDEWLRRRLDQLDKSYWRVKMDLETQASRAAHPSDPPGRLQGEMMGDDDPTAPQRLLDKLRVAAFADIGDYAANGDKARGQGLADWARKYLREGADFHELAGPNPHPKRPSPAPSDALDADVDKALADAPPIEKALIKKLASREELQALVKDPAAKKPEWHAKALDAARKDTGDAAHPLLSFLKTRSFTDKDFASYVGCDALLGLPASTDGGSSTLDVLKSMARQLQIPGADPEGVKTQADVFSAVKSRYPSLPQFCQDQADAAKRTAQQVPGAPAQNLTVGSVPSPGGVSPGARNDPAPSAPPTGTSASGGDKPSPSSLKDTLMKGAFGGFFGFLAGLLVAAVLPVSGLFVLGAVAAGAGIGMYMASKKDDKK